LVPYALHVHVRMHACIHCTKVNLTPSRARNADTCAMIALLHTERLVHNLSGISTPSAGCRNTVSGQLLLTHGNHCRRRLARNRPPKMIQATGVWFSGFCGSCYGLSLVNPAAVNSNRIAMATGITFGRPLGQCVPHVMEKVTFVSRLPRQPPYRSPRLSLQGPRFRLHSCVSNSTVYVWQAGQPQPPSAALHVSSRGRHQITGACP